MSGSEAAAKARRHKLFEAQSSEEAEVQAFIDLVDDDLLLVNGSLLVLLGFVR